VKGRILKVLLEYGCLNTMEICRALNNKDVFDPTYCGIPVYMKPFENRGKILPEFKWQTGNGICLHYRECKPNWKQVYSTLRRMHIQSVKMQFWDAKARIKKQRVKVDTFRFWFLDYKLFRERVLRQTLIPYVSQEVQVENE